MPVTKLTLNQSIYSVLFVFGWIVSGRATFILAVVRSIGI